MYHAPGQNSQRISFEAFTFVGAEDSVAYLQCDVVVCDSQDPNSRCNAGCLPATRRRRAPLIISDTKSVGKISSGPMIITHKKLRSRREVQISNSVSLKTGLSSRILNQSGKPHLSIPVHFFNMFFAMPGNHVSIWNGKFTQQSVIVK